MCKNYKRKLNLQVVEILTRLVNDCAKPPPCMIVNKEFKRLGKEVRTFMCGLKLDVVEGT